MYSVILSAGKSERMGRDKAFLKIDGEYFIDRIFKKLDPFSDKIIIVAGNHNYDKIKKLFPNQTVLLNADYELGQINSVKVAVKHIIENQIETPIMINLVDQPLIKKSTYKKITEAYKKNKNKIIIPYTKKEDGSFKRGHPIIIPQKYFKLILKAPYEKGLHWVTHHKKVELKDIFVKDKGIIKDFDNYKEYINFFK